MAWPNVTWVTALPGIVAQEFQQLCALIQGWGAVQHKDDGTHSNITADSLEVSGDVTIGGDVDIDGGIAVGGNIALGTHYLSGNGSNEGITVDSNGNVTMYAGVVSSGEGVFNITTSGRYATVRFSPGLTPLEYDITYDDVTDNLSIKYNGTDVIVVDGESARVFIDTELYVDGDAYNEVGNWTPVIGGSGGTSGQSYATQVGRYIKNGRQVTANCYVALSNKGTITGNVQIQGLPYATENVTNMFVAATVPYFNDLATNWMSLGGFVNPNSTAINIQGRQTAGSSTLSLTTADILNTSGFMASITYTVS